MIHTAKKVADFMNLDLRSFIKLCSKYNIDVIGVEKKGSVKYLSEGSLIELIGYLDKRKIKCIDEIDGKLKVEFE